MPESFALGPLLVSTPVVGFVVAVVVAIWTSSRLAKRAGIDPAWTRATVEGSILAGLIASRAAYAALYWPAYWPALWTILYFWQPGYLPVAGLAGGAVFVLYRLARQPATARLAGLRVVTTGAALGATLMAVILGTMNLASEARVYQAGDTVPNFRLADLNGESVSYSDLEGKGIVLNFWATWCPPCRREMPLLEAAWGKYGSRNIAIVGVDVDEPTEDVRRFVDTQGFTYPIWVEPESESDVGAADTNEMLGWFGSVGLPTTVFIGPDGVIDNVYIGELNRAFLLERITRLLSESKQSG